MVQREFKKQLKITFCPIHNTIIKIGVYFKILLYNILIYSQYDSTPFYYYHLHFHQYKMWTILVIGIIEILLRMGRL